MTADFSGFTAVEPVNASTLGDLAQQLRAAEQEVVEAEEALKEKIRQRDRIAMSDIPEAMQSLGGLTEFKLGDGSKITIKSDIRISTAAERMPSVCAWLRSTGNDGVIKSQVVVDATEISDLNRLHMIEDLEMTYNTTAEEKDSVHHQTLLALVRELMESGVTIHEGIKVSPYKLAKLTEARSSRK